MIPRMLAFVDDDGFFLVVVERGTLCGQRGKTASVPKGEALALL